MFDDQIEMNPFGGKTVQVAVSEQHIRSHGKSEIGPNGGGSTSTSRRQQQQMDVRKAVIISTMRLALLMRDIKA
jgi:hypothetical protein